ncbi:restriction endonuclease subunit S [Lutibacter sp. HS1-25]|nr:restriction endonuclease subunit S [Lutibacter sp. HS1-25]
MKKYTNYKDSGIKWLGEIPEHWEIKRIKDAITKIGSGVTPKGGSETYVDEGIPFIRSQNVYNDGLKIDNVSFITEEVHNRMKNSQLKPLDILINITGASIGRTCIFPESVKTANINQHIIYLRFKKKKVDYPAYYLKSSTIQEYIMNIQAGSSKEALNMSQILNIGLPFPAPEEQTQIANYLDAKTTGIDKKIKLLKQKIKHFKAYRKTLINEAVTRGLVNEVSNWINYRLKDIGYLYSGLSGKSGNDFNQDNNPNNRGFIPFTNIANNTYLNQNHLGTVAIKEQENQNQVKKNDIFFLMSSEGYEDIGKSAVLIDDIKETYLNSFCKGFRITNNNCEASFINYLLLSDSYRQNMLVEGKGFTRINLKMEKVNNFSIIIPPTKKEQQEIADYLDVKTTTIDKIVKNIETQITTLKELRKTLINEVVTGKIKVTV